MVAGSHCRHTRPHFHDDAGSLVPNHQRVGEQGRRSIDLTVVRVTQAGRLDFDQHLALARSRHLDFINLEGAVRPEADRARDFILLEIHRRQCAESPRQACRFRRTSPAEIMFVQ